MSESPTSPRPRQVTVGAGVCGAACLAMLLSVGSLLARLHTVDLRQGVSEFLAQGSGRQLGLGVDQALSIARVGLMVLGAVSAAMLVFAFFAARRDRSARIAMSVLAVPLVVCGLFVDVFLTGFAVAATVLLWTAPARDWFAGRTPRPQPAPAVQPPPAVTPAPYAGSYGAPSAPRPTALPVSTRPRQVVVACVTTWVFSTLVAGFLGVALASLGTSRVRDQLAKALRENPSAQQLGMSVHDLAVGTALVCVVLVLWALAAALLAGFVWRRQGWARVALLVSAVAAGFLALISSVAFPGFLLVAAACGISVAMLLHRDTSAWLGRVPDDAA